eukprot:166155_1
MYMYLQYISLEYHGYSRNSDEEHHTFHMNTFILVIRIDLVCVTSNIIQEWTDNVYVIHGELYVNCGMDNVTVSRIFYWQSHFDVSHTISHLTLMTHWMMLIQSKQMFRYNKCDRCRIYLHVIIR